MYIESVTINMPKESFNISFYGSSIETEFYDTMSAALKDEAYPKIIEVMRSSAVKKMREIIDDIAKKGKTIYHGMYTGFIVASSIWIIICFSTTLLCYFWPTCFYPFFKDKGEDEDVEMGEVQTDRAKDYVPDAPI